MNCDCGSTTAMLNPKEAMRLVLEHAAPLGVERVALSRASGRVLAQTVVADRDYPPFDRAMMDGYAVRLADAGKRVAVVGEATPGVAWSGRLTDGQAVSIMTGAPCPDGAELVVPVEQTVLEGDVVGLPDDLRPGRHIAYRGSDRPSGADLLGAGARITPLALAVMATVGVVRPLVRCRPKVALVATGNELLDAAARPGRYQIRDSNTPLLLGVLHRLGVSDTLCLRAVDRPEEIRARLAECESYEIVLLTGGVSAGRYDFIPEVVAGLGWRVVFHKLAQQPGKPLLFAERNGRLLFGLPGNPLAVHLCAQRYVAAAIRGMSGLPALPARGVGRLAAGCGNRGDRTLFLPARVRPMAADGGSSVEPMATHGSADIFPASRANAMLELAPGQTICSGAGVQFEWLAGECAGEGDPA